MPTGRSPRPPPGRPERPTETGRSRRRIHLLIIFVSCVLIVDALVGERGFLETLRARREYADQAAALDQLRQENARLREQARRLREDPRTVEEVARRELGLIRPGEVLFIIRDVAEPARLP
jgi:cell division protein FtsB